MINYEELDKIIAVSKYREQAKKNLMINFPTLTEGEVDTALDIILSNAYTKRECILHNNYTEETAETDVAGISNYIYEKTPIMVANGCLFKQYTKELTPMYKLITSFTDNRSKFKKEMFKYEKGTEKFNKYNMLQMLAKRDNNALYGVIGNYSSALYNLYVATGITRTGRALISHAITFFESFFTNNVKFHSIDEAITFINRVDSEKSIYPSALVLDKDIEVEDVFYKIMNTFDRDYFDDEAINKAMNIVWSLLINLSQETLNKLFYKNNALQFCDNKYMKDYIVLTLSKLDEAFVDPNHPPEIIKDNLDHMFEVLKEWCYMRYIVVDKIDRSATMKRDISIITDTDSTMPCFNGWYTFVLRDVLGPIDKSGIKLMNLPEVEPVMEEDRVYNFGTGEIETKMINVATSSNKEPLRFSIINILSYIAGRLLREHFDLVAENYNTKSEFKECLIAMKNEFLFKCLLLTKGKKNYADLQLVQEGNIVPENKQLDIKGLPMTKVGIPETTSNRLKKILEFDILRNSFIDQVDIIKKFAILEKEIYESLKSKDKSFHKPARIKSMYAYKKPMSIQGIKASVAYNEIKDKEEENIDLEGRNSILVIKTNITSKNADLIAESHPNHYLRLIELLKDENFKGEVSSIAIPSDVEIPDWIVPFIDYISIIQDNLRSFPLEEIGISKLDSKNITYTNIIQF
nr:MAG TPA: DNA polymerase [Caudoviricetes sp.]